MSDAPNDRITAPAVNERTADGEIVMPVIRSPNFARLTPNQFSIWTLPGAEPKFEVLLQAVENIEVRHFLHSTSFATLRKEKQFQVTELGLMILTPSQMQNLKNSVDTALRIFAEQQQIAGVGSV